jgi:hypothetical protein
MDLDHVAALAVQAWHPTVVMDWMTTDNGFLDGARPIDVLLQRGSSEVIDALNATLSSADAYPADELLIVASSRTGSRLIVFLTATRLC